MSKLQETIEAMKNDIEYQIHFNECWDETFFLSYSEVEDWLYEIKDTIERCDISPQTKLQMIVDSITGGIVE